MFAVSRPHLLHYFRVDHVALRVLPAPISAIAILNASSNDAAVFANAHSYASA